MHGQHAAALGGAVELGQHNAGRAGRPHKLLRLADRVLAGDRIEHEQHLKACLRARLFDAAGDLGKLVHQALLVVQPAGRIGDDKVIPAGGRALHCVKDDGGGVGPLPCLDKRHIGALRPGFKLFARRRAEGIAGSQQHPLAEVFVKVGELRDRRCLADAVDPDDEDHGRMAGKIHLVMRGDFKPDDLTQRLEGLLAGFEVVGFHLVAQLVNQAHGGRGADVGQDQLFFEVVVQVVVNLGVGQRVDDGLEKAGAGLFQPDFKLLFVFAERIKQAHKAPPLLGL